MSNEKCPVCGARDTAPFRQDMEMCRDCRLVWARKQYFGAPVYSEGREEAIYGGGKTALFRGCLKTLAKRFPGRGNLLDVGSAYGVFLGMAKTDGWNAEGIEVDPKTASSASAAGFKVHNRPIDELGLPAAYNVVTVFEVFCLMSEPLKAAVEMYRVLIPDGRIYIREFNGAFHMALEGRRIFKILGIRPSIVHNFNFTAESLRRMLARAGFKNIKIRNSRPTNGDPYGTGGRMGAALTGLAKNLYYYAAQLVYFASLGRLHVGSSFIIEAKK